jgi:hypothetical protein
MGLLSQQIIDTCQQAMAIAQVQLELRWHSFRSIIVWHHIRLDHHPPIHHLNRHLVLLPGYDGWTMLTKLRWIDGVVWFVPLLNSSQDTTRACMIQLSSFMCRMLTLYAVCVTLSVQMSVENATHPLSMKCLRKMTCSFKTPLSNRTVVLRFGTITSP